MKESRTKNTLRNMYVGLIGRVVSVVMPFVIRTIIIYRLGAEYAGLGNLFTSILQVLSVTELGFSSAIIFSLYRPVADDDINEICIMLTLYRRIYQIVGSIILVAGCVIMPLLPVLIKDEIPANINLYILYLIYLLNVVISYFASGYRNVILTVYQRQDILNKVDIVVGIVRGAIQILVLLICDNYYAYVIWLPVFTLLTNLFVWKITNSRYPKLKCNKKVEKERLHRISKQIKGVAIGKLCVISRNAFDSIIISVLLGLTSVTVYSNYFFVFSSISGVLVILIQSVSASVGNSMAVNTVEKNLRDYHRFDFYYSWVVSWCVVCLVCLYQPFMNLWVGKSLMFPYHTMILMCIYFYVNQLAQVRSIYSEAAGLWWEFRYLTILEMMANFVLNIVLGMRMGVDGIITATIITAFLTSFIGITVITFKKYFRCSAKEYFCNSLVYVTVTVMVCGVSAKICTYVRAEGILELLIKAGICIIVPNVMFVLIYGTIKKYREYLLVLLKVLNVKERLCGRRKC